MAVGMPAGMIARIGDWQQHSYVIVAASYVHWPWAWEISMNMATAAIAPAASRITRERGRWLKGLTATILWADHG